MFFNALTPKKENCCGCSACIQICPKSALSWRKDDEGFLYPGLDPEACIECGACEKVCPMVHSDKAVSGKTGTAYAAVNDNLPELMKSSSGGIFSIIANHVLSKGGIVYGAAFDDAMQLHHIAVEKKEELPRLRGSKYLQSQNEDVYTQIRKQLNEGRLVYYVGVGCQVAGLRVFLRRDYENLITSDILCHGVPPQSVFDEVVKYLEKKYDGEVVSYDFRDKKVWGWSTSSSSCVESKGKTKYHGYEDIQSGYFKAFIKAENYRESCYRCPFARSERCGDITLGDFWGVEKYLKIPNVRNGVSAIFINTAKGESLLKDIEKEMTLYPADIKDIAVINKTLTAPTPRPAGRDSFFEKFKENPAGTLLSYSSNRPKKHLVYMLLKNPVTSFVISKIKKLLKK